jgi:diadenosine tetraphosphate (Ap4A) HIT family hydrolase
MPEKIYVGILCDGTPHLHAHLIPRYPFTEEDADKYAEYFTKRDGEIEILRKIKIDDLGGYWYIFNKEQSHYKSYYGQMDTKKKVAFLEELATKLRLPKKSKESSN